MEWLTAARSVVRNVVLCGDAMVADRKAAYSADCVKPGTKECENRCARVWNREKKVSFVWSLTTRFTTYSQLFVFQVWKHWQVMLSLVMLIIYMVCHRRLLGPWWPCTRLTNYSRSVAYKWTCAFSRFSSHCLFRLYPLLVIFLPIIFSNDSV